MHSLRLTLITGRSTKQGTGISMGKDRPEYREATGVVELSSEDMVRLGLTDGSMIVLRTEFGVAEVGCRRADISEGMAFMAFGSACNQLVGGETCASGMPDSKHVQVEAIAADHHSSPPPVAAVERES
jgi:formylmethanofuran dehydrogenase subunit D